MTIASHPAMAEALALTRAGRLDEAMARIRATLGGPAAPPSPRPVVADAGIIDLLPERVTISSTRPGAGDRPGKAGEAVDRAAPPVAGSFTERRFDGPDGSAGYHLYIPAGAAPGLPLVVMLHGCTQSPQDFALGTGMNRLADELGFLVAYPAQTAAANQQRCWNWFRPGDQARDRGEPARIAGITRQIIAEQKADPARVYIAGLSAGGAMAAIMATAYPDLYAAVGVHSGLASGAARDLSGALMAMRNGRGGAAPAGARFVPVIAFHGDKDATVHERNGRAIVDAASAASGIPLTSRIESGGRAGGHRHTREIVSDAAGRTLIEHWTVHDAGHAWSGGDTAGSYTDPGGPDASRAMLRFFLEHRLGA